MFKVENKHIKSNNDVKLLGITVDHKLSLQNKNNLCNAVNKTFENFRGLYNVDFQIFSSNMGVLW